MLTAAIVLLHFLLADGRLAVWALWKRRDPAYPAGLDIENRKYEIRALGAPEHILTPAIFHTTVALHPGCGSITICT